MQVTKDPLEEWALHCEKAGASISLDSSGAPSPFDEAEWANQHFDESNDEAGAEARLREELRRAYNVDDDMIALAPGAQSANFLFMFSHLRSGDLAAVENPTFMPIRRQAEMMCAVRSLDRPENDGYKPDVGQLQQLLRSGVKVVALTNLHNPSAAALGDDTLAGIIDEASRHDALVLCDEVYREMAYGRVPKAAFELGGVSTSSVTKLNGLRRLRLGWLIGPPEVAQRVEAVRMYTNYRLPVRSCLLAVEAVKRREWFRERALERGKANLAILEKWLEGEGRVTGHRPDGGLMISLKLPDGVNDLEMAERLLESGVAVGPGRYWGAAGHIRVTFSCRTAELEEGLGTISRALNVIFSNNC